SSSCSSLMSPTIEPRPGGGWEADARIELSALAEATGFPLVSQDDEVDTLGGLVFSLAGRVPQRGEVLSHESGFEFEVAEADARKVRKIRIRRRPVVQTQPIDTPV
ncbi:MAG: transporter associated domain-containing protein, partial [Parvularculaceae bacterium]